MWSDVLNSAAWDWIKNNGGMTRENGDRFRKYILSVGNSVDLNQALEISQEKIQKLHRY
jgi:peptidyl-dipeptidase Dcp